MTPRIPTWTIRYNEKYCVAFRRSRQKMQRRFISYALIRIHAAYICSTALAEGPTALPSTLHLFMKDRYDHAKGNQIFTAGKS